MGERLAAQLDVPAAGIAGRRRSMDDAGTFENVEVMGNEIRLESEQFAKFFGGAIAHHEFIDQSEPSRFSEGRVKLGPPEKRWETQGSGHDVRRGRTRVGDSLNIR